VERKEEGRKEGNRVLNTPRMGELGAPRMGELGVMITPRKEGRNSVLIDSYCV
jgi:hypothetical protein